MYIQISTLLIRHELVFEGTLLQHWQVVPSPEIVDPPFLMQSLNFEWCRVVLTVDDFRRIWEVWHLLGKDSDILSAIPVHFAYWRSLLESVLAPSCSVEGLLDVKERGCKRVSFGADIGCSWESFFTEVLTLKTGELLRYSASDPYFDKVAISGSILLTWKYVNQALFSHYWENSFLTPTAISWLSAGSGVWWCGGKGDCQCGYAVGRICPP